MFDKVEDESCSLDPLNSLRNPHLESAIRAMLYSESPRNRDGFIRVLLESKLILLTETPIERPSKYPLLTDEKGFSNYEKDSKIPLVQLKDEQGRLILPVFTNSSFVHVIQGLNVFNGLIVSAPQALEMCSSAQSDLFSLNPGSPEHLNLHRPSILELVQKLKEHALLPKEGNVQFEGHAG